MATHPNATFNEKHQAAKEILVAERKLRYWENQSNFVRLEADRGITKIKKKWEN
jgi:hypothetical protein